MLKPRIRIMKGFYIFLKPPHLRKYWACFCEEHIVYGSSPEVAYEAWKMQAWNDKRMKAFLDNVLPRKVAQ